MMINKSFTTGFFLILCFGRIIIFAQDPCHGGNQEGDYPLSDFPNDPFNIPIVRAIDPNDILGPAGFGLERWVSINDTLGYTIRFENDPDFATAPAQIVRIVHPFDPHINPSSFRLGDFGFGSFVFQVPANTGFYANRLDVSDSLGVMVDITAGIDIANRQAFWIFESIDPLTGRPPADPLAGFLPVNDSIIGNGEGFVSFSVVPDETSLTGDTAFAEAEIFFDDNEGIITPEIFNLIDALPPTLDLASIPSVVGQQVSLAISIQDDPGGSGVGSYDLFVTAEGEALRPLGRGLLGDSTFAFSGEQGVQYCVYALARDNVDNIANLTLEPLVCFLVNDGSQAFLQLLGPAPNLLFCAGEGMSVEWNSGLLESVNLSYLKAGETPTTIVEELLASVSQFDWVVPSDIPSGTDYQLVIEGSAQGEILSDTLPFQVLTLPEANFSFSIEGQSVLFSQISTGADSFRWEFGDGVGSTAENPQHLYSQTGLFQVCLYVSNSCGEDSICQSLSLSGDVSGLLSLSGNIATPTGEGISRVQVELTGSRSRVDSTNESGQYAFSNLPRGQAYQVRPSLYLDYEEGISTLDILLIRQHLLGRKELDAPHYLIAGDVDGSKSVSISDILWLRQLILDRVQVFPNNMPSWFFYPQSFDFSEIESPFLAPDSISFSELETSISQGNFIGGKVGDVSGNHSTQRKAETGQLVLQIEDISLEKGETVQVPVRSSHVFGNLIGMEWGMAIDEQVLSFHGIETEVLPGLDKKNSALSAGSILLSWDDPSLKGIALQDSLPLFFLNLEAKEFIPKLSEVLYPTEYPLRPYAYSNEMEAIPLTFSFFSEPGFRLLQNIPNPAENSTVIPFHINERQVATLEVMDLTGRLIFRQTIHTKKGYNTFKVSVKDLSKGVYLYKVSAGQDSGVQRMTVK